MTAKSIYEFCRFWIVWTGLLTAVLGAVGYRAYTIMERGRRLSSSQVASLTESLKFVSKPAYPIVLSRPPGNDEATDVADEVKKALEDAGFKIDGVWPDLPIASDPIGVLVRRNPKDAMLGDALVAAFQKVKISANTVELNEPRPLDIVIARKPP